MTRQGGAATARRGTARAARSTLVRGAVTAVLGVALLGSVGCAPQVEPTADADGAPVGVIVPGRPGEQADVMSGAEAAERRTPDVITPADVEFMMMMIPHHEQALEMAALVPDRSTDPAVRGIASRISDTQGPEIEVFRAWLRDHGDDPVVAAALGTGHAGAHGAVDHTTMVGMATPEQLAALTAASGTAFDRMFLDLMIAHHAGAVTMAEAQARDGLDVQAGELADHVAAGQIAEIARMQDMYPA